MRNRLHTTLPISLFLMSFIGCGCNPGQYDFQGTWNGTLSNNQAPCSDGNTVPAGSLQISATIMTDGNNQLVAHVPCGDLDFTQADNIATQNDALTCPPMTMPTSIVTQTIHDTSLVLNVNALQVDLVSDYAFVSNGMTSSCNDVPATGVLIRTGS
jgi:hypothetical protein